jgi:hypothetical protein
MDNIVGAGAKRPPYGCGAAAGRAIIQSIITYALLAQW